MFPQGIDALTRSAKAMAPAVFKTAVYSWALLAGFPVTGDRVYAAGAGEPDQTSIVYVRSGRDAVRATLVPDHASGSVPNNPALVETTANGKPSTFHLVSDQQGRLELKGALPGLADGRHTGTVTTLTPEGALKDRKQLLIVVDSKSPRIERVAPEGDFFPRTAGAIRFRITDPENGSGVSIDPAVCDLNVAASGAILQDTSLSLDENELCLSVFVTFPGGAAAHDASFSVTVSLQDRAGNVGRVSETFRTRSLTTPVFEVYRCDERKTYLETAMEFLVEPAYSAVALTVGADRQLDVFTRGCFGKDYAYPDDVRELMRRWEGVDRPTEAEVVTMSPFFQKAVGDRIGILSTPANVTVRKMVDSNHEDSRISFAIRQNETASMGDPIDDLQLIVPVSCRIDTSKVDLCRANRETNIYDGEDSIYSHIPEEAFVFTYETITIPVFQEVVAQPFSLRVEQEDELLTAQLRSSPIELMDTAASWFAFLGDQYWFERQGDVCVAKGPAREGTVHYEVGAAHKIAAFRDLGGGSGAARRTMRTEGDILIRLDPPLIENFRFDRQGNVLTAHIDDRGTSREDLAIALWFAGHPLEAAFDRETGQLTAVLPYTPVSVQTASLSVTDLAEQTTTENCQVFGEIEETDASSMKDGTASIRGPYTYSPNLKDIDRVLGTKGNGKAVVEICDDVMKWGYYRHGRFVPVDHSPGAVRLVQLRPRQAGSGTNLRRALAEHLSLDFEIMGTTYDRRLYEPIPARQGGVSSLSATGGSLAPDTGRAIYFVATARQGSRKMVLKDTIFGFGLFFELKQTKQCRTENRDILAPVIRPRFDNGAQVLTAVIHDHGMPLSELELEVKAESDSDNAIDNWGYRFNSSGSRPAFTFQNGILTCPFVPPPRGEFFTLRIDARDKAGNRSFVDVDVVLPREPPVVSLTVETQDTHQAMTRNGVNASAFMTGEARDDAKIVPEKTTLWLDGQVLRPFMLYSHTPEAGWRSQFNYKAGYAAGVEEGHHIARFKATDAAGLWAETTAHFEFRLAPFIYDFKVMPDAVRRIGGPALTARIIDGGGDLDIGGLTLTIDGQPVDPARFYFDPSSGYFSVDGPLELADGPHRAHIKAIDHHGNQAGDSLRFTRAAEMTTADSGSGQDLVIEGLSLMELGNHNGDGQANPGELVRLFITLCNGAANDLTCAGRLSPEDPEIKVETASVDYGLLASGSSVVPMQGFDLRIGGDILDKTISDPYEAYLDLTLVCDTGEERVLPLTLPIFPPSFPIDAGMTVTLDRLPPTTTAGTIRVQGTVASTAGLIDWMEIRTNGSLQGPVTFEPGGGRYEAVVTLSDGANTIEVTAADSSGSRGSAAGYIYRRVSFSPPTITIAAPANGDYFVCDALTVAGTYSPGSGTLSGITVDGPWAGGNCPVAIIDGSHFSVNCGDVIYGPSGVYDIEVTIETTDGVQATDAITIRVGDCS